MSLPERPPLETSFVMLDDDKVEIRRLSRAETIRLSAFSGNVDAAENFVLACGAGVTEDEARAWREKVSPEDAAVVVDAICELSGLVEGAQKSG